MNYHEMHDKVLELDAKMLQVETVLATLSQIDLKSMNQEQVEKATTSLVRYEMVLRSALRVAKRMGLPEEVDQILTSIQHAVRIIHSLEMAYHALQVARMAAGDPLAWIQFGVTATSAGLYAAEGLSASNVAADLNNEVKGVP